MTATTPSAAPLPSPPRRLPIGAEPFDSGVHFRVWAPLCRTVEVVSAAGEPLGTLAPEEGGYFSGTVAGLAAGALYRFRLDRGDAFPDPASRFQPEGPHGPSQVVDPGTYRWRDTGWRGVELAGQVIYELHIGTFTAEGTWTAAERELPELASLGVTTIEMMPVADFVGRFGWGYDGVDLFAPTRLYGTPDDLRHFVDRAHEIGLAVILDVVYNHFGPDGNYLGRFSDSYLTRAHANDWGEAVNYYGPGSKPVRELVLANAEHWIAEYHFDGLRLDATQDIHDRSAEHLLADIAEAVRRAGRALGERTTFLVAENEPQEARLVQPREAGGYGLDALWNDDFHHTALVALTGRSEAYYSDYKGSPQELISTAKHGFLYQGQRYAWQKKRRGSSALGLPRTAFVQFLQNHDQVANSARGERGDASSGVYRALTAFLLLGPATPLLFQGQEFCSSAPFPYFADHVPELAAAVRKGRAEFLSQFPSLATPEVQKVIPDPADPRTFESAKLDFAERQENAAQYDMHRDLLRLRRDDPVLSRPGEGGMDGAVLSQEALVLRYFAPQERGGDRLLILNLGHDLHLEPAPEPLLAPPGEEMAWQLLWSSEDPRYGGAGAAPPEDDAGSWRLPGRAAMLLQPGPRLLADGTKTQAKEDR